MVVPMHELMLGNQAVARGAYEAGVRVATAYPGTPSTEITEHLSEYPVIDSEWSVNEKVALEIGIGASIAGARTLVSMKHVGLNVAMDPLMSISYPGVNAGLVLVVADDPGQHSSQNEQDSRYFAAAGKLPMLEPSDSQECKDFIIEAFELSERFDTVVLVRLTTRVAHSMSVVSLGPRNDLPLRDHDTRHGKYIVAPAFAKKRRIVAEDRLRQLELYAETTSLNRIEMRDTALGIVTSGIAYQYVREVAPTASVYKIGLSYPLARQTLIDFRHSCDRFQIVEELEPLFEQHIRSLGIDVSTGKDRIPVIGELSPDIVRASLVADAEPARLQTMNLPVRPPMLCAGCHHRGPFSVLRKLKLHVSGDIGCYTLAAFPPLSAMETSICMGASIGMAFGFEKARGREFAKKTVAVIGDSTFWHSGITALVDVVYNRGITTVIILDNRTTAMTGHQDNASTGKTLLGNSVPAIDFASLARSLGIHAVREVDAYDLTALENVIREEVARDAPSVIITKRPCILAHGVTKPGSPFTVDTDDCKACRFCMRLGCPALSMEESFAEIDPALCAGCGLCSSVCPFDAISRPPTE